MFETIEEGYKLYLAEHLRYTTWIKNCKSTKLRLFLYHAGTTIKQNKRKWQTKLQGMELALGLSEKEKRGHEE